MQSFRLLSLVFFVACSQTPQHSKPPEGARTKKLVPSGPLFTQSHDGLKIHYQTMGHGVPVLLLHGYYANSQLNWMDNGIAQALSKKFQVILMDMRGHGQSDKPQSKKAYGQNMWKDVITVLNTLKIKKAHMHGYSMGGSILTQILYHAPERVITATYGGAGITEVTKKGTRELKPDTPISKMALAQEKKLQIWLARSFPHDHKAMKLVGANPPWNGPENRKIDLSRINIPVLAIVGEYDSPNKKTARMTRELKNFKKVILPGKGHLTAITKGHSPPEYLNETLSFLERNL